MRILFVTHSSRPFFTARSQLNSLSRRFNEDRLDSLPELDSLSSIEDAVPYNGALSIWEVIEDTWSLEGGFQKSRPASLRMIKVLEPDYKIQSACFIGDRLAVLGADRLEMYNSEFHCEQTIRDNWLVGGHTISPVDDKMLWVNSAPANAILRVNTESGEVEERIKMPDCYGVGYQITPETDLHKHYIPTDLQPCHVNSCEVIEDGLLITLWIQGAVVKLDGDGTFTEIISGFRGCHGAKPFGTDRIVFADSPSGIIFYLDRSSGKILKRLSANSMWLHDVQPLGGDIIAATIGDLNELRLVDEKSGIAIWSRSLDDCGSSVMFAKVSTAPKSWELVLRKESIDESLEKQEMPKIGGKDVLREQFSEGKFKPAMGVISIVPTFVSSVELTTELVVVGTDIITVQPGEYRFDAEVICKYGALSLGLIDSITQDWIVQFKFDSVRGSVREEVKIKYPVNVFLAVAAANEIDEESVINVEIKRCELRVIEGPEGRQNGTNLIPPFVNNELWLQEDRRTPYEMLVSSDGPVTFEYLMASKEVEIVPGQYIFSATLVVNQGAVSAGIVVAGGAWLCQCEYDEDHQLRSREFEITEMTSIQFIVAAHNRLRSNVEVLVKDASLYLLD